MKEQILEYRMKHSLSQYAMAKKCGISPTTLLRIESGGEPSTIVRGKIEKILKEDN